MISLVQPLDMIQVSEPAKMSNPNRQRSLFHKLLNADPAKRIPSNPAPPLKHTPRIARSPLNALKATHPKSMESIARHAHKTFFKFCLRSSFVAFVTSLVAFNGIPSPLNDFK